MIKLSDGSISVDTKDDLLNYIKTLLVTYNSNFPGLSNLSVLTKDLPYHMGNPWINYQIVSDENEA
mgnify:CR=1 FL=1